MDDAYRELVRLADPDPDWARQYADEATRIDAAMAVLRPQLDHIGSTAVPLRGKPIIDVQIAVDDREREAAVSALEGLGYRRHGDGGVPGREYMTRRDATAAFNAHVFGRASSLLDDNRAVRDYLRAHPDAARDYVETKEKALLDGHVDLTSYSHAKRSRVAAIREAADRWARGRCRLTT